MPTTPHKPGPPAQVALFTDLPAPPELERRMREVFARRWARWHRCKSFEAVVADPVSRRLLELQALHERRHELTPGTR